jgi:hypothetical protein
MVKNTARPPQKNIHKNKAVLYLSFDFNNAKWKMAFSDTKKVRMVTIDSRHLKQLQEAIRKAKFHFSSSNAVRIVSCCGTGRDGFWLHQNLLRLGIKSIVADLTGINTKLQKQRKEKVQINAVGLLKLLIRYDGGEKHLLPVVRPSVVQNKNSRNINQKLEISKKKQTIGQESLRSSSMVQKIFAELSGVKQFAVVTVIMVFLLSTGYLLLNLKSHNSIRWGIEEIAPPKYDYFVVGAKESFVPGFPNGKNEPLIFEKFENQMSAPENIQEDDRIKVDNQKDDDSEIIEVNPHN